MPLIVQAKLQDGFGFGFGFGLGLGLVGAWSCTSDQPQGGRFHISVPTSAAGLFFGAEVLLRAVVLPVQ